MEAILHLIIQWQSQLNEHQIHFKIFHRWKLADLFLLITHHHNSLLDLTGFNHNLQ